MKRYYFRIIVFLLVFASLQIWGAFQFKADAANIYTLSYNANGGSGTMPNKSAETGTTFNLANNSFTREGYTFAGWSDKAGGIKKYDNGAAFTMPSFDVTLYAMWTPNTYTLRFNANNTDSGSSGLMNEKQSMTGTEFPLETNRFVRPGYRFAGWGTTPAGPVVYEDKAAFTMPGHDITLYAQWTQLYTLSYSANGGSGTMENKAMAPGDIYILDANTFTRTGYTFEGWSTSPGGSVEYPNRANFVMPGNNITLYAQWKGNTYRLSYNANGGSGSMADRTAFTGEQVALDSNNFTTPKDGYGFGGWSTTPTGEVVYANGATITMPGADTTLYAKWTPNTYTLNYDANGGSGTMTATTAVTDQVFDLRPNEFTLSGYAFAGWSTIPGGSVAYADQASYTMPAGGGTLYAVWERTDTLNYDANGGSGTMTASTAVAGQSFNLRPNAFALSGYGFAGWSLTPDGPLAYADGASYTMPVNGGTLYALWEVRPGAGTIDIGKRSADITEGGEYFVTGTTTINHIAVNTTEPVTITLDNASIQHSSHLYVTAPIQCNANVTLYIKGQNTLRGSTPAAGIELNNGDNLVIDKAPGYTGNAVLSAYGNDYAAGIGGNRHDTSAGSLTIRGGTIKAYGGIGAAGIGGGCTIDLPRGGKGGEVIISGGTVYAQGGESIDRYVSYEYIGPAGIGGGLDADGGTVIISGGTVTAQGGLSSRPSTAANDPGADIGGGGLNGKGGTVIITGGSVKAAVGGIGGGKYQRNTGTITNGHQNISLVVAANAVASNGNTEVTRSFTIKGIDSGTNEPYNYTYSYTGSGHGSGDTSLYFYLPPQVTLKYNANGGSGTMADTTANWGTEISLSSNAFIRTGYTFAGWSSTPNGAVEYSNGASYTMPQSNVTLYAIWTATSFKLTFYANGGTGTMDPKQASTDQVFNLPPNQFTRAGYSFAGWSTTSYGAVEYANEASYKMPAAHASLYAKWTQTSFTLSYDANGGSGTVPPPGTVDAGSEFTVANNTLTPPASKKFKEWNTAANGSGTAYAPGAKVAMPTQNLTLYAIWRDFTPAERIEADFDALLWNAINNGNSENNVKTALDLPKTGANGTTIAWSASPAGIINTDTGVVTRQLDDNKTVALTARVTYTGGTEKTKTFNLTVPAIPGKFEAEDAVVSNATVYGGAQAAGASGGKQVGNINIVGGSYVQWNNLPKSRTVEIRYASPNSGTISIYKNGGHITDTAFASTGGWYGEGCFGSLWLPLEIDSADSLKIQYDDGDAILNLDYIECYSSRINNAVISPVSLTFDRAYPADVTTTIEWNDAGSITAIKEGGTTIGAENYSVSGSTLTIRKEYLAGKSIGDLPLTIEFNKGGPATLTIAIIPINATISPVSATFDRNPVESKWADVTTSITWNDADSVTDVKLNGESVGAGYYSVEDNTLTIKGDQLVRQPFGDITATIVFDKGDPATLTIGIIPINATISPVSATFDRNPVESKWADVTTSITWNDADSVTDVKLNGESVGAGNYSVEDNTLTIKGSQLVTKPFGDITATIVFDKGDPATLEITVLPMNSYVSPQFSNFNKGAPTDVTLAVSFIDAVSVTDIRAGEESIGSGNYNVSGYTLTIKKGYLAEQDEGELFLTVVFDEGEPYTFTVTVTDSHSSNPSISPSTGTYDRTPGKSKDVTAAIHWNGANSVNYVSKDWVTIDADNYDVTEDTLTIKKEYLATLPVGDVELSVWFDTGEPVTLTITILRANATISPATGSFCKNPEKQKDVTVAVTLNESLGVKSVKAGEVYLRGEDYGVDYGTSGEITLIIKKEYLASQPVGELVLTIEFNMGDPSTLTITITEMKSYSVTYDSNGGEGTAPVEDVKTEGATFAAADNTFTPASGKKFKHWYTNPLNVGGTAYTPGATVTMPDIDLTLYAIWEDESPAVKRGYLEVKTLVGGTVTLNGGSTPLAAIYSQDYSVGVPLHLEAAASPGYTFAYWLNVENSSIISTSPVYEAIMGSGINITAVFSKVPAAEDPRYTVTFKDKSGRILQLTNVAKNGSVTPPAAPPLFGYSFSGWSHPSNNVTSDMIITPVYQRDTDTYTVTVAGGTLSTGGNEGSYRFDMPVTVTAGAAPDGQKFSHWTQDGRKVSTKSTFSFFAPRRNTLLTAVFVDNSTTIEKTPSIILADDVMVDRANGTIMFTAIKDLPAGYTLVESGVLMLKSTTPVLSLTVDTPNVILGKIMDTSTNQFYIVKANVGSGDTWYGRAYLIYKDSAGNTVTVYSDNIEDGTR